MLQLNLRHKILQARGILSDHVKSYVKTAAKRVRDPKTGRFVKQPQGQPQQPQARQQAPASTGDINSKNYSDSNKFLDDVVKAVLPDDDPIWNI